MSIKDLSIRSIRLTPRETSSLNLNAGAQGQIYYDKGNNTLRIGTGSSSGEIIATRTWVTNNLGTYVTASSLSSTLTNYVTSSALSSTLTNYVTNSTLSSTLTNYVTIANIGNYTSNINSDVTINGKLLLTGTSATKLQSGTTEQRPNPATNGMLRYNSTLDIFEGYINNAWTTIVSNAFGTETGVSSFNTRVGAVLLNSTDITGALGFTPVNKAGDTMTGTLSVPTLNATTQINLNGNKILEKGTNPVTAIIYGNWTLANGATLEATYAADLAEYYEGDDSYEAGTVMVAGGDKEVTACTIQDAHNVIGVVSANAAYIMNGSCPGIKNLIALRGRVPVKVIGNVKKGDRLVSSSVKGHAMVNNDRNAWSFAIALQDGTDIVEATIL